MQPALFLLCSGLLCLVRAQDGQDIEQRLSFLEDLNKPRITTKPRVVTEGVYVDLTCDAVGQPTPSVTWYKRDQVFNLESNPRASMPGTSLAFTNVNRADQGDYKCDATNHFGTVTADITLTVNYKPEITNQPSSQTVAEGDINVKLTCGVTGQPEPSVTWYKGTVALDGTMLSGTSLEFTNVQRADQGDYKCVATNYVGAVTSLAATLTVDHFDLQFDGSKKNYVSYEVVNVVNDNNNPPQSVCLWVKPKEDLYGYIFEMPNGFALERLPRTAKYGIKMGPWTDSRMKSTNLPYNDGDWHHFCLTREDWKTRFYQDGVLEHYWGQGFDLRPEGWMYIGKSLYDGDISGLNIWSRVLNQTEISQMSKGYNEDEGDIFKWRDARQGNFHGTVKVVTPSTCRPRTS